MHGTLYLSDSLTDSRGRNCQLGLSSRMLYIGGLGVGRTCRTAGHLAGTGSRFGLRSTSASSSAGGGRRSAAAGRPAAEVSATWKVVHQS